MSKAFKFNTAIITYPSDYDGLLSISMIVDNFKKLSTDTTNITIGREDPDDKIERVHYHCYWDDLTRKNVTESYFDIELPEPVVVFINTLNKGKRSYQTYNSLASQLGIDNILNCNAAIDQYVIEELPKGTIWDILTKAHPNIETKKSYGDKCKMLRYVMKQKVIERIKPDKDEEIELNLLQNSKELLRERANHLIVEDMFKEININSVEELVELYKLYVKKLKDKKRRGIKGSKTKTTEQVDNERAFCELIRNIFHQNPGITKREVLDIIENDENYYFVYASKYLNYNKLVNDSFKNKPKNKINVDWNLKYYVPNKLYDYLMWLDDWVRKWSTGKEECERRPKGLVLIGASRTGKSSLMATLGDYVYFKNIWSSDNWEYLPPYTIMDDMDAADEGKGLSFSWFKPWFGAQDSITITDKYRPKEDIANGKPLIWLNNFDITETFKSEAAQDYIKRNMVYVNIGNRPLWAKPVGNEVFTHKEYDPKKTWYYQNVVEPKLQKGNEDYELVEDEDEPLILRKKRLLRRTDNDEDYLSPLSESEEKFENEKGRPTKRSRTKD